MDIRYIRVLVELYSDEAGFIFCGSILIKHFRNERGTKQGNPLSRALFNSLLENIIRQIQTARRRNGYGAALGEHVADLLTNLRFADDLLVIA